jgi:hypothetical protein
MLAGGGAAGAGALATTGFPSVLLAIFALLLIVCGLLVVRAVTVKQERL